MCEVTASERALAGCRGVKGGVDGSLKGLRAARCRQGVLTEDSGSLQAWGEQESREFKPFIRMGEGRARASWKGARGQRHIRHIESPGKQALGEAHILFRGKTGCVRGKDLSERAVLSGV